MATVTINIYIPKHYSKMNVDFENKYLRPHKDVLSNFGVASYLTMLSRGYDQQFVTLCEIN